MPRAVAVGLPEPAPQISASPRGYQSHFSHAGERIWPETNCYLDLWIETLHALGLDPVPAFACALSADHDGLQWTFLEQQPEDLRRLYGLEVTEEIVVRYWKRCLSTRRAGTPDNFFHLLARHRTACGCNDTAIKLRRWVKSHRWIPLVAQRLRRVHDHLAGRN